MVTIRRGLDQIFIIACYDRSQNKDGHVVRMHQEVFCQALGFLPDQKYESDPSLQEGSTLLAKKSIRPAADRMALLQ